MDSTPCRLIKQSSWFNLHHPLHLKADKVKWNTQFGAGSDSPVVISLIDRQSKKHKPGLFVLVHLDVCSAYQSMVNVDVNKEADHCTIDLFCTDEFLNHYGLNTSLSSLSFVCVTAFPLNEVILVAETEAAFRLTQGRSFEAGLLVASSCNYSSFLLRSGDVFLSPPISAYGRDRTDLLQLFKKLRVHRCSPVEQGIVTINSSIVVIKSKAPSDSAANEADVPVDDVPFTFSLKLFDFSPSNFIRLSASLHSTCFSSIYISENCVRQLNLNRNQLVTLRATHNDGISPLRDELKQISFSRPFFCQILPDNVSNDVDHGRETLAVSTTSWFNMIGEEQSRSMRPSHCTLEVETADENALSYANEVHIALVLSSTYSPSGCFDKSLVNFFKTVQILKVGDVISIDVNGDYDFYEAADATSCRCQLLTYKVLKINNEANDDRYYYADANHTRVYQSGTTNSFVPLLQSRNDEAMRNARDWNGCPSGLKRYAEELIDVVSPYLSRHNQFDHTCSILVSGRPGCGKRTTIDALRRACNLHLVEIDCQSVLSESSGAGEAKINEAFRRAALYVPCVVLLLNVECVGTSLETNRIDSRVSAALCRAIESLPRRGDKTLPAIVVATTNDKEAIVADVRMQFLHQVSIESPSEPDRFQMLIEIMQDRQMAPDVDYRWLSKHTAGFVYGDLWEMMRKTTRITYERILEQCAVGSKLSWIEEEHLALAGMTSSHADVTKALHVMQGDRADTIGVPKIPDVDWKDIGGLEEVKSHILDTIQLPLDRPELVSTGLRRSGVLLYGPPGTGKTMLAKAVASQCSLSFLSVKGPELINMYVGQSEANVRRVFQRARDAAPCVVFFDELDALAPNRGRSGDSGGVMDRVVSQLLAELDGVSSDEAGVKQVFIIAASNRPDLIDQALLRPGRLDKLLYVGISESNADRIKVLEAQTRKLHLSPSVNLEGVVSACPANMTGADFYGLTSEAALNAIRRQISRIESGQMTDDPCVIEQNDFVEAAGHVVPSLTNEMLDNYKRVKSVMRR